MVLTVYFVSVWNYTIRAIYKVDIFMDMVEEEVSKELTILLSQLNKGDRVDMGQVVHGLSDVERDIFMEALNQIFSLRNAFEAFNWKKMFAGDYSELQQAIKNANDWWVNKLTSQGKNPSSGFPKFSVLY